MDRIHPSMSWSFPTDSGTTELHGSSSETPENSSHPWWQEELSERDASCGAADSSGLRSKLVTGRSFFLPLRYEPSYLYPLIVWFHNDGFNENQIDAVMPHISVQNYVAVGLRGTRAADTMGHRYDWHPSASAIAAAHDATCEAVEEAMARFSVNPSRVILAGYREGGTMAQRIALRDPDRFAGVVSLGGRIPQAGLRNLAQVRQRRLLLLWQWGQHNPLYTQENVQADCRLGMTIGASVEIRQYPNDDEMNTATLGDIDEWIMRKIVAESSISDSQPWASNPISYSRN